MTAIMKKAVCLSGYFSSKALQRSGGEDVAIRGHNYIREKIIDEHTDVFIHTWDKPNYDLIKFLYKPKRIELQSPYSFESELKEFDVEWFGKSPGIYSGNTIFRDLSMNFSRKRSMELIDDDYDCVIMARFDLGQRGKEWKQKYYATNFNFADVFDKRCLYSGFWDQLNHGFCEQWLYGGQKVMKNVMSIYDKLFDYYQPNSKYTQSVTEGWFDSNSVNDFSNEMLKSAHERVSPSNWKTFPKWGCIDNHKTYKWHIKEVGLYDTCKFVDITGDE